MPEPVQGRARLTHRQAEILDYICESVQQRGFPPSIREIGEAIHLSSSSTVHSHLRSLEEKHYIRRNPSKPRSIEIIDWPKAPASRIVEVPVKDADTTLTEEKLSLPLDLVGNSDSFLLRTNSAFYAQEAIMPGDLLIISPGQNTKEGDMVVTRTSSEERPQQQKFAVKKQESNSSDNDDVLVGKVVGVIRKLQKG